MLNRRSFFSRSGLVAATTVLGAPHVARPAEALLTQAGARPGKIIHIVSDGMSLGTLTCANLFAQTELKRPLTWMELYKKPAVHKALMNTRSLNSMVTDSSAASSAWGSGSRVVNGAVNVLPDGRLLTPLYTLFGEAGWKTALVTTAEITHATPAGFAVAIKSRGNSDGIAKRYLDRNIEVLLGGGRPFFDPKKRKDKRDLRAEFKLAGYAVVQNLDELNKAPKDARLLGTFADSHLPYTIDQRNDAKLRATVPTIAQMTAAALVRLERHEHFILQIEGARIDHAAHNSDAAAAIHDQIALDAAIDLALDFQRRHPDTLVVITTDHANSNLGLNGMGGGYRHSSQRFVGLSEIRMSYPEILKRLQNAGRKVKVPPYPSDREDKLDIPDPMDKIDPEGQDKENKPEDDKTKFTAAVQLTSAYELSPSAIIKIIAETTGYTMSERRAKLFSRVLANKYPALYDQMNSPITQLGQLMANRLGMGWTGNTHTSDYVPLLALGPGAERFDGFVENTDVFNHYTSLAGIDFKNVTAPYIAAGGPEAQEVEEIFSYSEAWV
jgi:alkaline phosphatase